jgi:hypothetical protein
MREAEMTRHARLVVWLGLVTVLALAGSALAAFVGLPGGGSQVNDDVALGIDPAQDAGLSDVAGGALAAGGVNVPWAAFEQKAAGGAQHVFVRAFKSGAWSTQGQSLNINPAVVAEAPSIDFAGPGRTVPWVAWYEPNPLATSPTQVFASRFCATGGSSLCAAGNVWVPEGQGRAAPISGNAPSLNIHVDRSAEVPSVAGGATTAGADPVPWVAWRERDGGAGNTEATPFQTFVARAIKLASPLAACPAGTTPAGTASAGSFCWQQVGLGRLASTGGSSGTGDPSLNVDPTRDTVDPDIAFTGPNDTVPWVVWYEEPKTTGPSGASGLGLRNNQLVFAAKGVPDTNAQGGFHWQAVGAGTAGQSNVLDTSAPPHSFGSCAETATTEGQCALNKDPTRDALDIRVAAGTLTPGGTTVPWVTWAEDIGGGIHAIFVARLVGGDHFELFNAGQPISTITRDSGAPDITFSGNTPYVSWIENFGSTAAPQQRGFVGHFEDAATHPVFRLDSPATGVAPAPSGATPADLIDARAPFSSGCTANPFTADGAMCPGNAAGTPFFLFTTAGTPQRLFAQAYAPSDAATGDATSTNAGTTSSVTFRGTVNPGGALVNVHFQFGRTTTYGSDTGALRLPEAVVPGTFSATVGGLPPGTTFHYRAVVESDFQTLFGADRTITSARGPDKTPPSIAVRALFRRIRDILRAGRVRQTVRVSEAASVSVADYLIPRGARAAAAKRAKPILLAHATARFTRPSTRIIRPRLTRRGRAALRRLARARIELKITAVDAAGNRRVKRAFKTVRR